MAQDYPKGSFEVIVVDDGSSDGTKEKLKEYPVKYIYQNNAGPARARNTGWRQAKGEIVFFTDSDCIPPRDWVSRILRNYDSVKVAGVGGSYGIVNPESLLAECVYEEILSRHQRMPRSVRALGSYNFSVKRSVLEEVSGFDESYRMASGEDNDLSYKILERGFLLVFAKDICVGHYHPEHLGKYLRTQFWHGFWRVKLYLDHAKMAGGDDYSHKGDFLQPPLAILILVLLPFIFIPGIMVIAGCLLVLELFLQFPIFFSIYARKPFIRFLALVPVTFLRAFARGLGLSLGILRFVIMKKPR